MRIKEISQNYDITPHTLRYYEKIGLLTPEYSENGYRQYSYEHIQILNTIRDLRSFDIPLSKIKSYLNNKNSQLTRELLQFEIDAIQERITELNEKEKLLRERIELIDEVNHKDLLQVEIISQQKRQLVLGQAAEIDKKDLYLELKKLHKEHEKELNSNNQNIFGSILKPMDGKIKHQVFYCTDGTLPEIHSETLPMGDYAAIYYGGNYKARDSALHQLQTYIHQKKLQTSGPFYEFYLLDFHETNQESEYVTKVEIQLVK